MARSAVPAPLRGPRHQEATYALQEVEHYRGNPFIEALPPIRSPDEAVGAMQRIVRPTPGQLAAPEHIRMHEVEAVDFFQPLTPHVKLHEKIDRMLRGGYLERNPLNPAFLAEMGTTLEAVEAAGDGGPWARGGLGCPRASRGRTLAVLGMSGVGKSQALRAVLGTYPQVLDHPRLSGSFLMTTQLVHLTLTCPEDGTIKGLCLSFLEEADRRLGTNYLSLYGSQCATLGRLRVAMSRISYIHGLGVLAVDEVQHLNQAKSGGAGKMIAFFKILSETVGVPVVVIGTPDAAAVVGGDFPTARRHAGEPLFDRLALWQEPGVLNAELRFFHERLFLGQLLRAPVVVGEELVVLLHGLNQGIPALDVKLFVEAQLRALELGLEELSAELLRAVHRENFGLMHPHLVRMARGDAPGPTYEEDLKLATGRAGRPAPVVPDEDAPPPARARRRGRAKVAAGPGSVTGVGGEAARNGRPVHEALSAAGMCRPIGAELLTGAGVEAAGPDGGTDLTTER